MRKLLSLPVLAGLLAIPTALGAPDRGDGGAVPALVDISRIQSLQSEERLTRVPSLRPAPSAFAAGGDADDSDSAPSLIHSSVADPLEHLEARDRLLAATRGARRARRIEAERNSRAAEEPAVAGAPATAAAPEPTGPAAGTPPELQAIAACESGGDPGAIGGGGAYRGKYQFTPATWQAVGGTGDPAAAPEAEQDRRAAILYAQSGASQWPSCGG